MTHWANLRLLDTAAGLRSDPELVVAAWAAGSARVLPVSAVGVGVDGAGQLALSATAGPYDAEKHFLLGLVEDQPWFAEVRADDDLVALRSVMDGLEPVHLQAAFTAVGLAGWHARARFCSACGAPTRVSGAGLTRACTGCGRESYPRTDPAVIVAILDPDQRLLLGRQPGWAPGRLSVFAGFVEVGESLEQAVHREMAEEVGLDLTSVRYLGSQPWPFPRSLMVSFLAGADGSDPAPAPGEIEFAAWFTPAGLRSALAAGEVSLPAQASVARRMIDGWLAGRLGQPG